MRPTCCRHRPSQRRGRPLGERTRGARGPGRRASAKPCTIRTRGHVSESNRGGRSCRGQRGPAGTGCSGCRRHRRGCGPNVCGQCGSPPLRQIRRAAERAAEERSSDHDRLTSAVASRWGTAPSPGADRTRWAQHAADLATHNHPSVLNDGRDKAGAVDRLALIDSNQENVRADSRRQLLGNCRAADMRRRTAQLRAGAQGAEQLLRELDTLPPRTLSAGGMSKHCA